VEAALRVADLFKEFHPKIMSSQFESFNVRIRYCRVVLMDAR